MIQDRTWLGDFDSLPPEKQAAVIDLIQFFHSRKLPQENTHLPQATQHASSADDRNGSFLEKARDLIGCVDDADHDLATHSKHMNGFGEDLGDRT